MHNKSMDIEWDESKRLLNINKHGVDFKLIDKADFEAAKVIVDDRFDYGETRYIMYVPIANRIHVVSFTWRKNAFRVISLRKANDREQWFYNERRHH